MDLPRKGLNFIISAPSAVGKSTIINKLLDTEPNLEFSISVTTRNKRASENQGIDYHYKSEEEFEELLAKKAFLEHAEVYGNYYGTLKEDVINIHQLGKDILFDIDFKGAENIKKSMPEDTISIFILPPSCAEIEQRLRSRNQDSEEDILRRLKEVKAYISHYIHYEYIIVNDDLTKAIKQIQAIIAANRLKRKHYIQLKEHINNL